MRIRPATPADFPVLQDIERSAGEAFRAIGMPEIADDAPFTVAELTAYQQAARAWVTANSDDHPIAYLVADPVDGNLHIEQVSVHAAWARHGLGRALIEHAASVAAAAGQPALTLTTFTEVPWNAPYYQRLGFRPLPESEVTPGLLAIRQTEAAHGLDRWPRLSMRRDL
ncbi:MAG TPA: GNAT family N-acetyltransferase [Streptosporangiaceae bacterium]|jgi:predicted N-acetyltransferase YhbS|nr:GNAT family N-acetyltransferase [Streptosporangiaceae bacterium]